MNTPQPNHPAGGTCGTAHPDPGRLLSLGDAARRTRTPLLQLRAAIAEGRLATLPALHLGQPIRLVEPEALLAAFPQAILADGPLLDPVARGINWIGTSADEAPPGVMPLIREDSGADWSVSEPTQAPPPEDAGESDRPPRPKPLAAPAEPGPSPMPPVDEPRPGPGEVPTPPQRPAAQELPIQASPAHGHLPSAEQAVRPMGGDAPAPLTGGDRLADLFGDEGSVPSGDEGAQRDDSFEGGRFSGEPLLGRRGGAATDAVQLGLDVQHFEKRRAARRAFMQLAVVVGSGLFVSAWMFYSGQSAGQVLASDAAIGAVAEDEWDGLFPWETQESLNSSLGGVEGAHEGAGGEPAVTLIEVPESAIVLSEPATVPDPVVVPVKELHLEQADSQGSSPVASLAQGLKAPRATGPACSWWSATQPGGPLRDLLGPCQGPWNEAASVVVGLHRHRGVHTCTQHLSFLRDRGGDLARETVAAQAAEREALPSPLMGQRVEGAARRMLRARLGTWVESGFEAGGQHYLVPLPSGGWRVESWVREYEQGRSSKVRRFLLELKLSDGPHRDQETTFKWLAAGSSQGH